MSSLNSQRCWDCGRDVTYRKDERQAWVCACGRTWNQTGTLKARDGWEERHAPLDYAMFCQWKTTPDAEKCIVAPLGWWCSREKWHDGPCAAREVPFDPGPFKSLIEALERGGYDAASVNLKEGEPLKVESLEAVMKCVTFNDPYYVKELAKRCARAAKVCRFFHLNTWADLFLRAEGHFLADYEHQRIHLHRPDRQGADEAER